MQRLTAALADRYAIERELGAGGMATVYLAEDIKHRRKVAVKVLRPELAQALGSDRFLREIEIAAKLNHPHIVGLLDSGNVAGFLFYVMPLVEGESLRDKLAREGELPVTEAARILRDVADALGYAHAHSVIHRDIKPENIMLSGRHALVTDFGVAKAVSEATGRQDITTVGVALGTPAYMAPEQAAADPHIDQRADIYAVGVVAYEMLVGRPPFAGGTPQQILAAQVTETADPVTRHRATVPPPLADLVMRCLAKRPADRPQAVAELLPLLESFATPSGSAAAPVHSATAAAPRARVFVGVAVLVIAAGAAVLVARAHGGGRSAAGTADSLRRRVAVLPFVNASGDSTKDFYSAISEEIASGLDKVQGLTVLGRESSLRLQGRDADAVAVGRELHVGSIVSGTIQRFGDSLHITARLVSTRDGAHIWSHDYDGEMAKLYALENEISRSVADTLQVRLLDAGVSLVAIATTNPEAHTLFLQATTLSRRTDSAGLEQAIRTYQSALQLDPKYAVAWAGLAGAYGQLADAYRAPRDMVPLVKDAATKAIALDDRLADGHLQLGSLAMSWEWNFPLAQAELRRALQLNPRSADAHWLYGVHLLQDEMDVNAARDQFVQAERLDPLNPWYVRWESLALGQGGDTAGELRVAKRIFEIDPGFVYFGDPVANALGDAHRWLDCLDRIASLSSAVQRQAQFEFAICASHTGRTAKARGIMADLIVKRRTSYVDATLIAGIAAALGEKDSAFAWLERAFRDRSANLPYYEPGLLDPLRDDPRLLALAKRVGLPWALRRAP
jgi:TolB-like protein/tRNA A-37 threonylcarbamoyl transferase component Bud32/Tfp pilus assembly protein PilF